MSTDPHSTEARNKLVDEHVKAEVDRDLEAIMRTWGESPVSTPSRGILKDVGIGLRLGNSRSGLGNIIHIDLAFPLDGDSSIDDVQILVETKERF